MKKREAIVFIDGNNWYHNSKSIIDKPSKIDILKLSEFICSKFNVNLKKIRYYNSIPDISDDEKIYYKHLEFLKKLEKKGIIIRTRKLQKIDGEKRENGIDVLISVDMIRKTLLENECECCIIISGDADFIPAMEIIKKKGFEAISCCVPQGHASELKEGKFRYLILKKKDLLDNCLS